jgi:hypothetical protein
LLSSYEKRRKKKETEGVSEQSTEENIWTKEWGRKSRIEKTTQ